MQLFPGSWGLFDAAHLGVSHTKLSNGHDEGNVFDLNLFPGLFQTALGALCQKLGSLAEITTLDFPVFARNLLVL